MSYPPYGQNPQHPQQPQNPYGPPQPPQNPYGRQPPPPQQSNPNPYGRPQQPPPPQQPPNPYGRPQQPNPYGPPPQNPYGHPQQPPNPYGQKPPQNPYGQPPQPPRPPQQPPYGGGSGGPGGPGGPAGPGGPMGPGSGGGGPRRSRKGVLIASVTALVLVAGVSAVVASNSSKNKNTGTSADGTSADGGTSWVPPKWAVPANDVGHADPNTVVTGTVWFAKSSPENLAGYATEVGTPGDSKYHKFLSPSDFNSTFANHADASQAVTQWVQQAGMKVLSQTAQSINVSTTVAEVEKTLSIKIDRFKHAGRTDLAPTGQPKYPANVGDYISSVTGLTTSSPVNAPKLRTAAGSSANCSSYYGERVASGADTVAPDGSKPTQLLCGYTVSQLRSAYGITGSNLTGQGVTIAVVDAYASPTIVQDVNRWSAANGLPQLGSDQFKQVLPDSYDAASTADLASGWWGEETLDVEAVHAVAPDAKIVYYAARKPDDADFFNAFQQIVSGRTADIVTNSWGSPEGTGDTNDVQAGEQIFQQAAAEGITFNFSTGDDGDYTQASNATSSPTASYPSSDPFVTGVGGTSLGIGAQGQYQWETGWGDVAYPQSGSSWDTAAGKFQGGGGGGNSVYFPQPSYQKGVVPDSMATAATGKANREEPDVSMLADPLTGLTVGETTGKVTATTAADGGVNFTMTGGKYSEQPVGGTSLASPLFSGMEALVVQSSGSPLGYANPVLYHLNGTSQFHDVVPNPVDGHEPSFLAQNSSGTLLLVALNKDSSLKTAKGYDDVTGLGSPTASFLTWFKAHPNGT